MTGHLFEFLWEFRPNMLRGAHKPYAPLPPPPPLSAHGVLSARPNGCSLWAETGADWPSGIPGESPVGRRGWDGPKYRPTPLTKRPFSLTSPAPTLFYATQNTYY